MYEDKILKDNTHNGIVANRFCLVSRVGSAVSNPAVFKFLFFL